MGALYNPRDEIFPDGIIISKVAGKGIKVDELEPTFGWRDIIGDVSPKVAGVGRAIAGTFIGGKYHAWFYSANDICDMVYHIPHDYVPNSDLHLHLHWGHIGTAISGQLVVTYGITYAKGHDQAIFPAEVAPVLTVATTNITAVPQYRHRIDEIQISAASPTNAQINSSLIEPDGLLLVGFTVTTIPTITGGATNLPAFLTADVHYQSTSIGTKQKAPDFYT
jgi:hypothetical protein